MSICYAGIPCELCKVRMQHHQVAGLIRDGVLHGEERKCRAERP
jgi:hypothetical protein